MLLEIENIKFNYSARGDAGTLLEGVNLSVPKGKVTALIGGNGVGKTTLFNIISGFEKNYTGTVKFNGNNISNLPPYKIANLGIGRTFQGHQLAEDLTLMENMVIADPDTTGEAPLSFLFHGKKLKEKETAKREKAISILEHFFGPGNKYLMMLDHKAKDLSYGEQRIIAIVRLLMSTYELVLLDEPTSGVNTVISDEIIRVIRGLVEKDKMTVLLIDHNMDFVKRIADNCAFMYNGKILISGPTDEILNNQDVRNRYLGV